MNRLLMFLTLGLPVLIHDRTFAESCFDKTFCSTGLAPKFILCGRGKDCSKSVDRGMGFKSDCTVSWWLGDAKMMKNYSVHQNTLTILKRPGLEEETDGVYTLSHSGTRLTSRSNPKWVYSTLKCR
jgi:hypothetical protein